MKIKRIFYKSIYSCCYFIVEYLGVCIWFVCSIFKDYVEFFFFEGVWNGVSYVKVLYYVLKYI